MPTTDISRGRVWRERSGMAQYRRFRPSKKSAKKSHLLGTDLRGAHYRYVTAETPLPSKRLVIRSRKASVHTNGGLFWFATPRAASGRGMQLGAMGAAGQDNRPCSPEMAPFSRVSSPLR